MPEPVVQELQSILSDSQQRHLNKYLWVVHKVLEQQAFKRRYIEHKHNGFAPIHSQLISAAVTANFYHEVMTILKNSGILLCDEHYVPAYMDPDNAESKGYKIGSKYMESILVALPVDKGIAKRVQKSKHGSAYVPKLNHEKHLRKHYDSFYVDTEVYSYIEEKYWRGDKELQNIDDAASLAYLTDLRLIESVNNSETFFIRDGKTRRIFHELNLMRREYRAFWRHRSGERLVELDLRNSQPLILCTLFPEYFRAEWPEDVVKYKKLCEQGLLYNHLLELGGYSTDDETRNHFKETLFAEVFYCPDPKKCRKPEHKARYYTQVTQLFEKVFPNVYKLICDYKPKNDYAKLPITMMQREANLIIDTTCNRLMLENNGKVNMLTIHDSIVTTEPFAKIVGAAILESFANKYSIYPALKAQYLDNGQPFEL